MFIYSRKYNSRLSQKDKILRVVKAATDKSKKATERWERAQEKFWVDIENGEADKALEYIDIENLILERDIAAACFYEQQLRKMRFKRTLDELELDFGGLGEKLMDIVKRLSNG